MSKRSAAVGILSLFSLFTLQGFLEPVSAQDPVGGSAQQTLPLGPHEYVRGISDIVNPATGSLSLRFQVPMPPGRGVNIPFSINYDTNGVWHTQPYMGYAYYDPLSMSSSNYGVLYLIYKNFVGNGQTNNPPWSSGGWSYSIPQYSVVDNDTVGPNDNDCFWASDYQFLDPSGGQHPLLLGVVGDPSTCNLIMSEQGQSPPQNYSSGGDNQFRAGLGLYSGLTPTVIGVDGTSYTFTAAIGTLQSSVQGQTAYTHYGLASQIEDRNGNLISIAQQGTGVTYQDTLGRNLLKISSFAAPTDSINVSGISSPYQIAWASVGAGTPAPNFTSVGGQGQGNNGTRSTQPGTVSAVQTLTLPNGDTYTFSYDPVYGLINKITYPTGAWVRYTWGPNSQSEQTNYTNYAIADTTSHFYGMSYTRYDTPAVQERDVSYDGKTVALKQTFNYSTVWSQGGAGSAAAAEGYEWTSKTTTVTDTDEIANTSSLTTYTYSPMPAPVDPNTSSYLVGGANIPVETSVQYGNQLAKTEIWVAEDKKLCEVDTANGVSSGTFTTYVPYSSGQTGFWGDPSEIRVYDYGSVSPNDCGAFVTTQPAQGYPVIATWPKATPLTDTTISYQSFNFSGDGVPGVPSPFGPTYIPTLLTYPSYVTVTGAGGNESITGYGYDANALGATPGVTQHDEANYGSSSPFPRANVTSIIKTIASGHSYSNTTYTYDETGNQISATDANGNPPTLYTYNLQWDYAYLHQVTRPPTNGATHVMTSQYDYSTGHLLESVDENSQPTDYTYNDPLGRLTQVQEPPISGQRPTTQYSYIDGSAPSMTTTNPVGVQSQVAYDGFGRSTLSTLLSDPQGPVYSLMTYDGEGNSYKQWNPTRCNPLTATSCPGESTFGTTTYSYDQLHRNVAVTNPDGTATSATYNANVKTATDENGNVHQYTTSAAGALTRVVEPGSLTTSYSYDALNNLTTVTQNGGSTGAPRVRSFTYDSLSRLLTATNPETGTICYGTWSGGAVGSGLCGAGYDPNGNLLTKTDARGISTSYSYDVLNRLLAKSHSDGTLASCYSYDTASNGVGRVASEWTQTVPCSTNGALPSNPQTSTSIVSYDPVGRVKSQSTVAPHASSTTLASYDLAGHQISLTYPDGRMVQNGFDAAGRLNSSATTNFAGTSMNQPYFASSQIAYDPAGHLTYINYQGGQFSASYDNRERVSKLTYGPPGPLWSKQYAYTANNNLQSETDLVTGVQRQYNYDSLNRLIAAQDIYSNLAVPSSANDNTGSTSSSGSGAEETPGGTGALQEWTDPNDSNILPNFGEPNSNWQGTGVTLNTAIAPDGTSTGTTLLAASSPGVIMGGFVPDPSIYAGETMGGSIWLKATTPTAMNVYLIGNGTANGGIVASTQAQLTTSWQQVQVRGLVQGTPTALSLQIGGGSPAVTGQNIYMWNPMVEDEGIAGTSVTNYLPYSQLPTASTWSGLSYSVSTTPATAPDGSQTAAAITAAAVNTGSYITDSVANPAPFDQQAVTGSVFLRAISGTLPVNVLIVENTGGNATVCGQTPVTLTTNWQRVRVPCTAQNALSKLSLQVGGGSFVNSASFQLWGAQLELATVSGPYVATDSIPATMQTSLTNLLPYSESLYSTGWAGGQNTVSSTPQTAPDGSLTAWQISAPAQTNIMMNDQVTYPELVDGETVTGSIYLKWVSGATTANVAIYAVSSAGTQYLGLKTVTLTSTWQRFQATVTLPSGLTAVALGFGNTENQVYDAWGAQLEISSHAGPYVETSAPPIIAGSEPTNILPNSQTLSGANWGTAAGSITSNSAPAPDGTTSAAVFAAASNSTDSFVVASVPNPSLYDQEQVTASVFLRVNTGSSKSLNVYLLNNGDQGLQIAQQLTASLTTSWQRFDLTATLQNGLTSLYLQVGGGTTLANGASIQIWGAQLVIGGAPAPYTPTPSTTTIYATGQPGTLVETGLNQTYSYDSFGNILQNGSFQTSYTANNQMFGYAYDAAGNLLSDGMNIMTWDAESRMTSAGGATFIYDAEGNRVEKQGTANTDTIYFGGNPIARYSGGQWTDLIYGPRGLLAEVPGTAAGLPVFRATDALGSVVGSLMPNSGPFVDRVDHTPFGQIFTGNTNDPYFFTGKERDAESGLDYFDARMYASSMGRFMSPDPSGLLAQRPADPQSWNLYAYARNNPLINIDPTGLDCVYANDAGNGVESIDHSSNSGECGQNGGSWAPGYVNENWVKFNDNTHQFQAVSLNGTVDYTTFAAGAATQFNANESACTSGCSGFSTANAGWLQGQLEANGVTLGGYLPFLANRTEPLGGGLANQLISGPVDLSSNHWAGPGGFGPPGGQGDWAASVHDYSFSQYGEHGIQIGMYFNPTLSPATSNALIQSNSTLIRNAGGIQGVKMGMFFGVVNAFQLYANSWK